ncbi:hypothetical protein ACT453_49970, partial [Bacillus sp. D-CC]
KLLIQIGYMQGEAEKINAIIGLVQMVVLIPVSVATAFSMSLVPEMTKAYTAGNVKLLYKHLNKSNYRINLLRFSLHISSLYKSLINCK